jgi:hypothetical protein
MEGKSKERKINVIESNAMQGMAKTKQLLWQGEASKS